jgi:hypothetical protein
MRLGGAECVPSIAPADEARHCKFRPTFCLACTVRRLRVWRDAFTRAGRRVRGCMSGGKRGRDSGDLGVEGQQHAAKKMSAQSPMAVDAPKAIDEDLHRCVTSSCADAHGVHSTRCLQRRQPGTDHLPTLSRLVPPAAASWLCTAARRCGAWRVLVSSWWAPTAWAWKSVRAPRPDTPSAPTPGKQRPQRRSTRPQACCARFHEAGTRLAYDTHTHASDAQPRT